MGGPCEYIYTSLRLCIQDRKRYTYIYKLPLICCIISPCLKNQALFGLQCALLRESTGQQGRHYRSSKTPILLHTPSCLTDTYTQTEKALQLNTKQLLTNTERVPEKENTWRTSTSQRNLLLAQFEHILPYLKTLGPNKIWGFIT